MKKTCASCADYGQEKKMKKINKAVTAFIEDNRIVQMVAKDDEAHNELLDDWKRCEGIKTYNCRLLDTRTLRRMQVVIRAAKEHRKNGGIGSCMLLNQAVAKFEEK